MTTSRRDFVQLSLLVGGAAGLGLARPADAESEETASAADGLTILVLGGTGLIGPPRVRYAIARGHTVTLFNRGKTNTHLFPDLEKLRGDRNDDLGEQDNVIGKSPEMVEELERKLTEFAKEMTRR